VSDPLPVPISATLFDMEDEIVVTFDGPLTAGSSIGGNWITVADRGDGPKTWLVSGNAVASGNTVAYSLQPFSAAGVGSDRVSYLATPPDLLAASGAPVAAFADFPLSVV